MKPTVAEAHASGCRLQWRRTGPFCGAAFCMDAAAGMFCVVLPYAALDFGANSFDLGVLGAVRGGTYLVACLVFSPLADRVDRKKLILPSVGALILVYLMAGGVSSFRSLCAANVAWAVALSFFWPAMFGWVGDTHEPEQLGVATGAFNLSWVLGGMVGGLVGGWGYGIAPGLPFLLATIPVLLVACIMVRVPHSMPQRVAADTHAPRERGVRRRLVAAWLGNMALTSVFGLMSGVFPKLGLNIGVNAALFGMLMAGSTLGRAVVFFAGLRDKRWCRDGCIAALAQLVAAGLVVSVTWANSVAWIAVVFGGLGVAMGITYSRGIFASLEHPGGRGFKSAMHEGTALLGVLVGSLGGGLLAQHCGLRSPYLPLGGFALALMAVQLVLIFSARTDQGVSL